MPYDTDMLEGKMTGHLSGDVGDGGLLPADAARFIPQKPPFVFVSGLIDCGETYAVTVFEVPSDCELAAGGVLREGGITEFMAQSCATFVGYRDFLAGRTEPSVGVLGALSRMKIGFLPPVGSKLSCRVETVGDFGGMQMFYAKVHMDGGRLVAEGRLTTSGLGNAE